MRFQKTICAALVTAVLSGCASTSNPVAREFADKAPVTEKAAVDAMTTQWNAPSVEREGKPMLVLVTPFSVPAEVRSKQIRLELESGATVKDLVAVMANLGYSIILADKEAGEKQFYLPRFSGTVGNLLNTVSRATDVWFTWTDGTIVVSSTEKVSVSLPQEEALSAKVAEGLKGLGAEAAASWEAGMVTLPVTPSQLAKVRTFLQRMTNNAALVSLQVAILNVQLNQSAKQGIDWTKLQLAVGSKFAPSGIQTMDGFHPVQGNSSFYTTEGKPLGAATGSSSTNGSTSGTTSGSTSGSTSGTTTGSNTTVVDTALTAVGLAGGGLKGLITSSAFSFTGLFDFLQTYGSTETKQNVVLKTVGGTSVELKSLTQTPYVESVSVTSTGNGTGSAGAVGSAKTAKADDGLSLKLTPTFDASANTVTIKMDLSLKAVLGFNQLSAGNQIGNLSQPTTAERSFNDVLRVRPGQTVVVGGLVYDSIGKDGNNLNFVDENGRFAHKGLSVTRNSMFIVVRPSVTSLGQVTEETGQDLFGAGQVEVAAPVKAAPTRPTKTPTKKAAKAAREEAVEPAAKAVTAEPVKSAESGLAAQQASVPGMPSRVATDVLLETAKVEAPAVKVPTESSKDAPKEPAPTTKPSVAEEKAPAKDAKPVVKPKVEAPASYDADGYATVPLRSKE
jgi:hypothetical protein